MTRWWSAAASAARCSPAAWPRRAVPSSSSNGAASGRWTTTPACPARTGSGARRGRNTRTAGSTCAPSGTWRSFRGPGSAADPSHTPTSRSRRKRRPSRAAGRSAWTWTRCVRATPGRATCSRSGPFPTVSSPSASSWCATPPPRAATAGAFASSSWRCASTTSGAMDSRMPMMSAVRSGAGTRTVSSRAPACIAGTAASAARCRPRTRSI